MTAPAIPSIIAKLSIAAKFVPELAAGMGLQRKSKASAGLFLSMFLGFALSAPIFLTGSSTNLMMFEMLPQAEREAMTWLGWLRAAALPGLLVMGGGYLLILLFLAPRKRVAADSALVGRQLQSLGPLSRAEKITLLVLVCAVSLWVTESLHGVKAVTVALAGLVALLASGVVDKRCLQADLGWSTLIFLGVILNLGTVFTRLGIDSFLGQRVSPLLAPLVTKPLLFVAVLIGIAFALRFLVVSVNALLAILILVLAPVAAEAGLNVWVLGFAVQFIGHAVFVLPYQSANFIVANDVSGGEAISAGDATKGSLLLVLVIGLAILLSLPLWRVFGLIG